MDARRATARGMVVVLAVLLLAGCPRPGPQPGPSRSPGASPSVSASPAASGSPGVVPAYLLNPDVTQATIGSTICVTGWTATVRPPASYTSALKVQQLAASGAADQNPADYEEDHWIPLELGGNPGDPQLKPFGDPRNLWPQLWPDARRKDLAENAGRAAVCSGKTSLAAARLAMFTDWGPGR